MNLQFQIIDRASPNMNDLATLAYDFDKLAEVETRLRGADRESRLIELFQAATQGSDTETWRCLGNLISRSFRHALIWQPMYADRTAVTDPLVLLELGEGRCFHVARFVIDLALANGYPARMVQLAAHQTAEVQWEGRWHIVEADLKLSPSGFAKIFPEFPSVAELARMPELLDQLLAGVQIFGLNYKRTLQGQTTPFNLYYPARFLLSSIFFGREIVAGRFDGRPPEAGFAYYYKNPGEWQNDRYYGWMNLRREPVEFPVVPVAYAVVPPKLVVPEILYPKAGRVVLPVRFIPAYRPRPSGSDLWALVKDERGIGYEIRVSSQTRGLDYDFRDIDVYGRPGAGDIARIGAARAFAGGLLGADIPLDRTGEVFVEVQPLVKGGEFIWPSNETRTTIIVRR